jgi:hypothetical protein
VHRDVLARAAEKGLSDLLLAQPHRLICETYLNRWGTVILLVKDHLASERKQPLSAPSASSTAPTTSPEPSSKPEDSESNSYPLNCEEPINHAAVSDI